MEESDINTLDVYTRYICNCLRITLFNQETVLKFPYPAGKIC